MAKKKYQARRSAVPLMVAGAGLMLIALAAVLSPRLRSGDASEATGLGNLPSAIPAEVDFPAPALALSDLQGNPVALADLRGKYVLVNNWATWCPPCRAEMPELEAFYQAHREENFVLVGISAGDPADQVATFVQQIGVSFPMWLDPDEQALRAFRTNSLPSSYVIDPQGQVRLAWTGAIRYDVLEAYVAPLLQE